MTAVETYMSRLAWLDFHNDTGEAIPPHSCLRVEKFSRVEAGAPKLVIKKPDAWRFPVVGFTGPWLTPVDSPGVATLDRLAIVQINGRVGRTQGNVVGPTKDKWYMSNASEGFTLLPSEDIDTDELQAVIPSPDDKVHGVLEGELPRAASVRVYIDTLGGDSELIRTDRIETGRIKWVGLANEQTWEAGTRVTMQYEARGNVFIAWLTDCPVSEV